MTRLEQIQAQIQSLEREAAAEERRQREAEQARLLEQEGRKFEASVQAFLDKQRADEMARLARKQAPSAFPPIGFWGPDQPPVWERRY